MPESAELELTPPPGFESAESFKDQLGEALERHEEQAEETSRKGRGIPGQDEVLAQKASARPAPFEPRRGINPRVAARDKWKRMEAISRLVDFLADYRQAWRARRPAASTRYSRPGRT